MPAPRLAVVLSLVAAACSGAGDELLQVELVETTYPTWIHDGTPPAVSASTHGSQLKLCDADEARPCVPERLRFEARPYDPRVGGLPRQGDPADRLLVVEGSDCRPLAASACDGPACTLEVQMPAGGVCMLFAAVRAGDGRLARACRAIGIGARGDRARLADRIEELRERCGAPLTEADQADPVAFAANERLGFVLARPVFPRPVPDGVAETHDLEFLLSDGAPGRPAIRSDSAESSLGVVDGSDCEELSAPSCDGHACRAPVRMSEGGVCVLGARIRAVDGRAVQICTEFGVRPTADAEAMRDLLDGLRQSCARRWLADDEPVVSY